jgi:hypothetical protein
MAASSRLDSLGLLGELIFPCQAACGDDAKSCGEAADSDALTCIASSCGVEIDTGQTTCQDRSSDGCDEAVDRLAECAQDCMSMRATAFRTCRATQRDCRTACDSGE